MAMHLPATAEQLLAEARSGLERISPAEAMPLPRTKRSERGS